MIYSQINSQMSNFSVFLYREYLLNKAYKILIKAYKLVIFLKIIYLKVLYKKNQDQDSNGLKLLYKQIQKTRT